MQNKMAYDTPYWEHICVALDVTNSDDTEITILFPIVFFFAARIHEYT